MQTFRASRGLVQVLFGEMLMVKVPSQRLFSGTVGFRAVIPGAHPLGLPQSQILCTAPPPFRPGCKVARFHIVPWLESAGLFIIQTAHITDQTDFNGLFSSNSFPCSILNHFYSDSTRLSPFCTASQCASRNV